MSQSELSGRAIDQYAQQVKTELATAVDAADLITAMVGFDEQPVLQNARILSGLKQCLQSLAVSEAQSQIIQDAYTTLGARFELDLPNG